MTLTQLLTKAISGLRMAGLKNIWQAFQYSSQKSKWERSFGNQTISRFSNCGKLISGRVVQNGLDIEFRSTQLHIRFLAPNLVRVTWGNPSAFPPYAIAKNNWSDVAVAGQETALAWKVETNEIKILVSYDGMIQFRDTQDRLILQQLPPEFAPLGWRQGSLIQPEECFYGLGEQAANLNLRGKKYHLWNSDPGGIYWPGDAPLYCNMPVYWGNHPNGKYLLFYENSYDGWIDLGSLDQSQNAHPKTDYVSASFSDGPYQYYFIPGPYDRAISRFTELTGRPTMPPRWALGYHQSLVAYQSEQDLQQLYLNFVQHHLPISAIHLDLEYMDGFRVFTIDEKRFPHFKDIAKYLDQHGCRLVGIVDAGVKEDHAYPIYQEGTSLEVFCPLPDGTLARGPVWPGWCVFPDFTKAKTREWWGKCYQRLLDAGITGFWNDMNEPAIFVLWGDPTLPKTTLHALENQAGDHRGVHNLYALLENQAAYEGLRNLRPQQRPFLLTRSGWVGIQRYAWKWTGDTACTWENLRQTVATVLGASLSGITYDGPDIGGFNGTPDPELYLRWFQLAAFLPFFRGHAVFITPKRCPWDFGEPYLSIAREFLQLRYRLIPYLYTLAWNANQNGQPLVRPLFWMQPEDQDFYSEERAFLLGDSLLVVPVTAPNAKQVTFLLPSGTWYSLWYEHLWTGKQTLTLSAELARIPVLVRAGTVLFMEEGQNLTLHVYPPIQDAITTTYLYTDAGDGTGPGRIDKFTLQRQKDMLILTWESQGDFAWSYSQTSVMLHGLAWKNANLDGIQFTYFKEAMPTTKFQKLQWQGCQPLEV